MNPVKKNKFEYLDHTADVQIHAWGDNLKEAFEQCGLGLFGYISPNLDVIEPREEAQFECTADDLENLLYHFLDECLSVFTIEPNLVCSQVHITEFRVPASGAAVGEFAVRAVCRGEPFDRHRHESGTEVKAITYSNMQIHNPHPETKLYELFVVIDI